MMPSSDLVIFKDDATIVDSDTMNLINSDQTGKGIFEWGKWSKNNMGEICQLIRVWKILSLGICKTSPI